MFWSKRGKTTDVKVGDLIGFSGYFWDSAFINIVTYGVPFFSVSHVGIVGEHDGRLLLFESNSSNTLPCQIRGKIGPGVQANSIDCAVQKYNGAIWHYPLSRPLYQHERQRLIEFLTGMLGRQYDYIGAFRSGGIGFSWLESRLRDADLNCIFCSELVAASHAEIGILSTDNVSRWSPNRLLRHERWNGILRKPTRLK